MAFCAPVFIQYHLSHTVSVMLPSYTLGGSTTVSSEVCGASAMTAACRSKLVAAPAPAPAPARLAAARGEAVASYPKRRVSARGLKVAECRLQGCASGRRPARRGGGAVACRGTVERRQDANAKDGVPRCVCAGGCGWVGVVESWLCPSSKGDSKRVGRRRRGVG